MATFGNSATPGSGYFNDDFGNCQFWTGYGTFPGGIITDLYVYFAGDGASVTAQLAIWGDTGVIWASSNQSIPSGTRTIGGQGWRHVAVPNVYWTSANMNLGFWTSGNVVWTYEGSGTTNFQRSVSGGATTLSSGGTEGGGGLGAYIVYTPGNGHVDRAGSFANGPASVMRNGTFTNGVFYVMRNGVFVQGN